MKQEILFNKKTNNYTLKKEIDGEKSQKRIPMKYKEKDKTSKYRKEELKKELLIS